MLCKPMNSAPATGIRAKKPLPRSNRAFDPNQTNPGAPSLSRFVWQGWDSRISESQPIGAIMSLDAIIDTLPDYAKDLKLNYSSLIRNNTELTPQQLWGTVVATAIAT